MGRGATATGGSTAKAATKATTTAEASAAEASAPDYRTETTTPAADTRRAIGMAAVLTLADRHLPAVSIYRDRGMVSLHATGGTAIVLPRVSIQAHHLRPVAPITDQHRMGYTPKLLLKSLSGIEIR